MKCSWREGNKIQLLENGEQYYPAVFKAIGEAQERIILETFIWFEAVSYTHLRAHETGSQR